VAAHEKLITFVKDRPGHDRRYAIDAGKIERELGWRPAETFERASSTVAGTSTTGLVAAACARQLSRTPRQHPRIETHDSMKRHHPRRRLRHAAATR
jgi:hypothetical protein